MSGAGGDGQVHEGPGLAGLGGSGDAASTSLVQDVDDDFVGEALLDEVGHHGGPV